MRKFVFTISLLTTITFQLNAQWFWQNPLPQGNDLYSISTPEKNLIYALSGNGFMI
jgi:hypothetical protein